MRFSRHIATMCFVVVVTTAATADPIRTKIRFSIRENGSFAGTTFQNLGTPQAAALVTAGCAAFGADCSGAAAAGAALLHSLGASDSKTGNEHKGIYKAPEGYEICKAKIDWGHTAMVAPRSPRE